VFEASNSRRLHQCQSSSHCHQLTCHCLGSTIISIGISDKGLRCIRGPISELVVGCALQIVKYMLDSLPVSKSRIGVESGKNSGGISTQQPRYKDTGTFLQPLHCSVVIWR
jgi:hypothetical protein